MEYEIRKIKGSFQREPKYEEFQALVQEMAEKGYELHSVVPQHYNGVTELNVIIFYKK